MNQVYNIHLGDQTNKPKQSAEFTFKNFKSALKDNDDDYVALSEQPYFSNR
jgi:hypothetical protein